MEQSLLIIMGMGLDANDTVVETNVVVEGKDPNVNFTSGMFQSFGDGWDGIFDRFGCWGGGKCGKGFGGGKKKKKKM